MKKIYICINLLSYKINKMFKNNTKYCWFTYRAIQQNEVKRSLMQQYNNISEYLQNKLKVDEETLNLAVKKEPSILRINIGKLNQLIDILHQNGITSNEILQNARIFYFNIETIQNRIKTLKEKGLFPNLVILTQAQRVFDRYVKMIKINA